MINQLKELFLVKRVSISFLILVVSIHVVMTSILNLWLFPSEILTPLVQQTQGLISGTLVGNAFMLLIMFLVVCRFGGVGLKELGLDWKKIPAGIAWTIFAWCLFHAVLGILHLAVDGSTTPANPFAPNWMPVLGNLIGQFLGNALYEETVFRGFLLIQATLILKKAKRKWSWGKCLLISLILTQLIFALIHIPNRIFKGSYDSAGTFFADQAALFIGGVYFASIWLFSRNLFAAIGIHAIVNRPTALFSIEGHELAMLAFLLILPAILVCNWVLPKMKHARNKASKNDDAKNRA